MKITQKEKTGNKVKLEVEVDYGQFQSAMERVYSEASEELNIPGFRKGKAPRDMVEKYIDKNFVTEHAAQDLISAVYPEIIKEAGIEPVDYPNVVIKDKEEGKPFSFTLEVDVYPEVKLSKYKGLAVESGSAELTEKEIDEFLKGLKERFKGPIDEEDVKKRLAGDKKMRLEAGVKNKLIEKVAKGLTADIPPGMVHRETDLMIDELKSSLVRDKLTYEDYLRMTKKTEDGLRKELRESAQMRARSKVALRAIAAEEKLALSDDDLNKEISTLAETSGINADKFRQNIGESGLLYIKDYLLRRKALEFIISKAKITVKKEVSK